MYAARFRGSHILPSIRLGFAPEPLPTLVFGSRISPECEEESGPQAFFERRRLSSQRVNGRMHMLTTQEWVDDRVLIAGRWQVRSI